MDGRNAPERNDVRFAPAHSLLEASAGSDVIKSIAFVTNLTVSEHKQMTWKQQVGAFMWQWATFVLLKIDENLKNINL